MKCCVRNCTSNTRNNSESQEITYHKFPKDEHFRIAWIEALSIPEWEISEKSTVCSLHFQKEAFLNTKSGLKKLRSKAVPLSAPDLHEPETPATSLVCRICLSMNVKMYNITNKRLSTMFEDVTGIPVREGDMLPQQLCWECTARVRAAHTLRDRALRSNELMTSGVRLDTCITMGDVKSISRFRNNLISTLGIKIIEPDHCELQVDEQVKSEETDEFKDDDYLEDPSDDITMDAPSDGNEIIKSKEIEIKLEDNNEIFFEEYPLFDSDDNDDDDDDEDNQVLSEMYKTVKCQVKKKKCKVDKKVKEVKPKKREPTDDNPVSTIDKYKTSDVKRRKADGLDENLFTITTLSYDEQIAEIERRQESYVYKNAPYKCLLCYRGFHIKDRYDVHAVRHSEASGAFECFICKTRMKTARALRKHLTGQHTEKFMCNGCPFVTRNRGVAREHEKWHAGKKYQCPHCPSEFDKHTTYMGHIRIKHVSDFVCELCGFTFVSEKGIFVHKKKKHRLADKNVSLEGPYCEVCDVKFVSEEAHSRHLKLSSRHSSDSDPNRIRNDSQSISTERNGRMARRTDRRTSAAQRDTSAPPDTPITCEQCGVQLRDLRLYAQHFRRAHPDKNRTKYPAMKTPCMCEQCGRIFQSMALLKDHMWVHTGEKRFKCDRCDKSFTQKTNLMFHKRVHSATRPSYECPICGKHFSFYNNRRRHMFIHTGLKPYKCDTCGKCFTTAGEQRAHVEHVHLKKPWPKRVRARPAGDEWRAARAD